MRDRLRNLHQTQTDSEGFSTVELDNLSDLGAAASQSARDVDGVLQEAGQIRLEIQQIQNDIIDLKDVNYETLNKTTFNTAAKRDSSVIGADIKRRGEGVLQRLHTMNALSGQLEAERGTADPTARIARTQYQCLSHALQEVMYSYNDTEMSHREACKRQILRQMEVVGREVSEKELEEMMDGEEVTVFSIQLVGKTAHTAFLQIESRQKELLELEKRIEGIQELFLDVALLVEEQGVGIQNIQRHVQSCEVTVQEGAFKLERATATDKNNPFKKLFCGCFPCYNS